MVPGLTGSCVIPGTPSAPLHSRMPCQWIVVSAGSWLSKVIRKKSPAVARISGPGTVSPYAHVATFGPPRSSVVALATRVFNRTFCPGEGVVAAAGPTVADPNPAAPVVEQAVRAPALRPSPPMRMARRDRGCMGMPFISAVGWSGRMPASDGVGLGIQMHILLDRDLPSSQPLPQRLRVPGCLLY